MAAQRAALSAGPCRNRIISRRSYVSRVCETMRLQAPIVASVNVTMLLVTAPAALLLMTALAVPLLVHCAL